MAGERSGRCPGVAFIFFFYLFFFLDNFVATPLRLLLQEEGHRLSPPGFPLGPDAFSFLNPLLQYISSLLVLSDEELAGNV